LCAGSDACNDSNECTDDWCEKNVGCKHSNKANGTVCGSELFCHIGVCGDQWQDLGNETIMNYKYKLLWQKSPPEVKKTWNDAKLYCDNLTLAEYADWRLPLIDELRSLIIGCPKSMLGGACPVTDTCGCGYTDDCYGCSPMSGPGAEGCYFASVFNGVCKPCGLYCSVAYWSSTVNAPNTGQAWVVSFDLGYMYGDGKTAKHYVRCVRSEQ
jgi:hypothetical protein